MFGSRLTAMQPNIRFGRICLRNPKFHFGNGAKKNPRFWRGFMCLVYTITTLPADTAVDNSRKKIV